MTTQITSAQLKAIVTPGGKAEILDNTAKFFNQMSDQLGINTPLRKAHFIAQIAHESAHFNTTREYGGSKTRYAPWYGRGLIQTTWEANYADFTKWCKEKGIDSPNFATAEHRDKVAMFPWALLSAVCYWDRHDLNELADKDDIRAITKKINGGYNGLPDRIKYLNLAKKVFGVGVKDIDSEPGTVTVKRTVADVQQALVNKGFKVTVDNKAGTQTKTALMAFQKLNGLVPDGVLGPKTEKVLFG